MLPIYRIQYQAREPVTDGFKTELASSYCLDKSKQDTVGAGCILHDLKSVYCKGKNSVQVWS